MAVLQPSPTSAAVVLRTTACRMWFAIMRSLWCGSATQTLDRHSRPRSWQSVMISKFRGRRCAVGCGRRGSGYPALSASAWRGWCGSFQKPCARSIAVAGLGHSIGSPTTTLPSATSNGNATKYVIPAMAHLLNHTSPYGRAARVQTCHAHSH